MLFSIKIFLTSLLLHVIMINDKVKQGGLNYQAATLVTVQAGLRHSLKGDDVYEDSCGYS